MNTITKTENRLNKSIFPEYYTKIYEKSLHKDLTEDLNTIKDVDALLDLNNTNRLDKALSGKLTTKEAENIGKTIHQLSSQGIIGWEYFKIDGEIKKRFLSTSI